MATMAWHWLNNEGLLRDGTAPPPDGEWLEHEGEVELCHSGLHASKRLIDALRYAPSGVLCRVECDDIMDAHDDKFVCRRRRILWRMNVESVLADFARRCALDVVHLWDAPDVVMQYLKTGDASLARAAHSAADAYAYAAYDARAAANAAYAAYADITAYVACAAYATAAFTVSVITPLSQNRRLTAMVAAAHKKAVSA